MDRLLYAGIHESWTFIQYDKFNKEYDLSLYPDFLQVDVNVHLDLNELLTKIEPNKSMMESGLLYIHILFMFYFIANIITYNITL